MYPLHHRLLTAPLLSCWLPKPLSGENLCTHCFDSTFQEEVVDVGGIDEEEE